MTVRELKRLIEYYPDHFEVLLTLKGQDDIFVTCEGVISGKFVPFTEPFFESCIGEIKNEERRNCVGIVRKELK